MSVVLWHWAGIAGDENWKGIMYLALQFLQLLSDLYCTR
eukprot:COSAG05_NODE_18095_length_314_cov_0.520930_1_plen_38_part_10